MASYPNPPPNTSAPTNTVSYASRNSISNVRRKAKITLTIVEARDLLPMDKSGLSDPFVVVIFNKDSKTRNTTKIQYQTLHPTWNETFQYQSSEPLIDKFKIVVWDYDKLKNDFEGQFSIPVCAVSNLTTEDPNGVIVVDEWFPLHDKDSKLNKKKEKKDRGEVHIIFKYEPEEIPITKQFASMSVNPTLSAPPVESTPPLSSSPASAPAASSVSAPPSVTPSTPTTSVSLAPSMRQSQLQEHFEIDYNELTMEKELGRGAFGIVYKGKWRLQDVAVKVMLNQQSMSSKEIEEFKSECQLMMNLRPHRNVVPLLGVCLNPESMFCLVTDFVENGSLERLIRSPFVITWQTVLSITKSITAGIYHLHKEHILHRDLAARNILLRSNFEALIADFGLSKRVEINPLDASNKEKLQTKEENGFRGPYKWMAPESLSRNEFTVKSDAYSMGVVLFEIISRQEPYPHLDIYQAAKAVVQDGLRPPIPPHTPSKFANLMKRCWETDPEKRPDFNQISEALAEIEAEIVRY